MAELKGWNEKMPNSRFSLKAALLVIVITALIVCIAGQGRLIAIQERRIASLEATTRRYNAQSAQIGNVIIKSDQSHQNDISDLRREMEAIRQASTQSKPQRDVESFATVPQGEWVLVTVEAGGRLINSGEMAAKVHLFVNGEAFHRENDGKINTEWTMTFDPTKQPAEFDATIRNGKSKGQVYRGIYKIEGDTWTYCHGKPGGVRPTTFASPTGSSLVNVVARRKKKNLNVPCFVLSDLGVGLRLFVSVLGWPESPGLSPGFDLLTQLCTFRDFIYGVKAEAQGCTVALQF